jgi:sensor histidine kinase YesM
LVTDLYTLADLVGKNSIGGLKFDDYETLTEDLTSLQVNPHIISAHLYSTDGKKVASYVRDKGTDNAMGPAEIKNLADSYVFHDTYIESFKKIIFQNTRRGKTEFLGTVYLQSDLQEIQEFWEWLGYIVTAIFLVSLMLAFLLASKLQQFITAPIYSLLDTMNQVTTRKDF